MTTIGAGESTVERVDGEAAQAPTDVTGYFCLSLVMRVLDQPGDSAQLRHEAGIGGRSPAATDLVRIARAHGLRAELARPGARRLAAAPMPAIAELKDGSFVTLGKVLPDRVLLHDPASGGAREATRFHFERQWSGRLVLLRRESEVAGEDRRFDFTWFVPPLVRYRGVLGQTLLASLIIQLFGLAIPLFTMLVMDKVLVTGALTTLDVLALGLLAVSLFEFATSLLRQYLFAHTTNRVDVELKARLFRHLTTLPVSFFESRPVGALTQRLAELEAVRSFLTGPALTAVIDLGFTIVFLAVMYYYAPGLTWIVVGFVVVFLAIYGVVTPVLRERLARRSKGNADTNAFLVETISGIETLKSLAAEPEMRRRWEDHVSGVSRSAFDADRLSNATQQTVTLLNRVMTGVLLWLGAKGVIEGTLTPGQLMAVNMLAGRVTAPAQRLAQLWQQLQQAQTAIKRLGDIMNQRTEPERSSASLLDIRGRVAFLEVTFRYRTGGPEALRRVTLDARPGERIGIVGASGSGKSTLAKLIQRLHVPESGKVMVDGVDLALVDPTWLRRRIGLVLQENFLLNRSIRENIVMADPGMTLERVVAAAELAGAHDFILELPEGYDTVVGERGAMLSGGQRQRIALARALAADPRILILDEATSSLDLESERVIHENMKAIAEGRTVFVIAHRLAAVRRCDRILVMERGSIVEEGTHDSLLARRGSRYARLWHLQLGEAIEVAEAVEGAVEGTVDGAVGAPAASGPAVSGEAAALPAGDGE